MKVRGLTFAIPVQSRNAQKIVEAVSVIYSRIRALRIPVLRVHTDRAREFCSRLFRKWLSDRGLYFTTSAGTSTPGTPAWKERLAT